MRRPPAFTSRRHRPASSPRRTASCAYAGSSGQGGPPRSGVAPSLNGLTARELEVLRLVGRGQSNREIATELFISEHTAANHIRSILMKTQSANRTAAARYAMRHGVLGEGSDDGDL